MIRARPFPNLCAVLLPILLLGACGRDADEANGGASREAHQRQDPLEKSCAASATYDRLKGLVFDEARKVAKAPARALDQLQASVVVRMENPVVASRDDPLTIMSCTGRFIVELPPGVTSAFDGAQRLAADVGYTIQRAADDSGLVYTVSRAEPIVYRLAAFDLPQPVASPAPAPQVAVEAGEFPEPVPPPLAPPVAPPSASPSFDCRFTGGRIARMICSDPRLAALDRRMEQEYESAVAGADRHTARVIERSRDPFAAYLEDCPDAACIASAYRDRIEELHDYSVDQ